MMGRSRLIVLVLLLALSGGAYGFLLANPTVEIRLTHEQVQKRIEAKLPLTGRKLGVAYEVASAKLEITPEDRLAISADVRLGPLGRGAELTVTGDGTLVYNDGSFYLRHVRLQRASFKRRDADGVGAGEVEENPVASRDERRDRGVRALQRAGNENGVGTVGSKADVLLEAARNAAGEILARALDHYPIYTLKDRDLRQAATKLLVQDIRLDQGEIVILLDPLSALVRTVLYVIVAFLIILAIAIAARIAGAVLSGAALFSE